MRVSDFSKVACLPLSLVLTLSSSVVFGSEVIGECVSINNRSCRLEAVSDLQASNLKLSTHEVEMDLNRSWSELYTDGNWFDAKTTIQNLSSNPGSIDVKVVVLDGAGNSLDLCSIDDVRTGYSWTTTTVWSKYKSYTVYVRASDNSGTYTLKYWDSGV